MYVEMYVCYDDSTRDIHVDKTNKGNQNWYR